MQIELDPYSPIGLAVIDDDGCRGVVTQLVGSGGEVVRSLASALTATVYWGAHRTYPWRQVDVSGYLDGLGARNEKPPVAIAGAGG